MGDVRLTKKNTYQGMDGATLDYSFEIEGLEHFSFDEEEPLTNANGNVIAKISCTNGKLTAYVNCVHAIRLDNVHPLSITDAIRLEIVEIQIAEYIKKCLKKHLKSKDYSDGYIEKLNVKELECNLTLQTCGRATPHDLIALFDLAFDRTVVHKKRKKKEKYEKEMTSCWHTKPKEYKVKCYNKTLEQWENKNTTVEPNLVRIEIVFLDRYLKRLYGDNRPLSKILTQKSLIILCREYKRVFEEILEIHIKPCLNYCTQRVFESLTYSDNGSEISETIARHKELIPDFEILRRALKRYYRYKGMEDHSKQAVNYYRKKDMGIGEDVLKTLKLFHKSIG